MKRKLFFLVVLALAVVISQCAKETDEDAIRDLIEADTIWFNPNTEVDSAGGSYATRDTTIGWLRGPQTHSAPVIDISIVEDSAWVSWQRHNYGHLYVFAAWPDTLVLWTKNLEETAAINATFLRTGTEDDEYRGWELNTISLAYGVSDSVNTVRIDSVVINSTTYDHLVITDPLDTFFDLDNLITFASGEAVTITLYTNVDDGHAYLHTFVGILYVRVPFTPQGDGVYQGTWNAQLIPAPRFVIFDLMPHSTLYTSEGPYDFNGWLLPYMISL